LFRNSGNLNPLGTSGPVQPYIRIVLHLLSTKQSSIDIIQRFQKILRNKVNAPRYIRNNHLHRDLQVDFVTNKIQEFAQKHEGRLHHHENVEAIQILDNMGIVRRLQRKKNF